MDTELYKFSCFAYFTFFTLKKKTDIEQQNFKNFCTRKTKKKKPTIINLRTRSITHS